MALRLITWNIENFAKVDDDGEANAHYESKLDYVSARINALMPDVVALQEVLDLDALAELAARTKLQAYAAPPDHRGNRVAFLARRQATVKPILDYRLPQGAAVQRFDADALVVASDELRRPFWRSPWSMPANP